MWKTLSYQQVFTPFSQPALPVEKSPAAGSHLPSGSDFPVLRQQSDIRNHGEKGRKKFTNCKTLLLFFDTIWRQTKIFCENRQKRPLGIILRPWGILFL
ncbi:MAG: hypothetical protein Q4F17_12520 [Eubacteriales bacterium]|nr:hypothetical protein [Eubacteriales bacterium]